MFQDADIFNGFSVDDIDRAKEFYGTTLGLKVSDKGMGIIGLSFKNGGETIIYPKDDHQPATYTILNFPTANVESAVDELAKAGIEFIKYTDGPVRTDEKGIMRGNGPTIAWFKDPAGNILSVIEA